MNVREGTEVTNRTLLATFLCLQLVTVMFWQGSSCRSADSNLSNNSARGDNVNANTSVNSKTPSNAGQSPADVSGVWGGLHINLEVTESGATLDYDCAHGTITERIVPDREGKFSVKGFHVRERPGPTREGDETRGQPAIYSGSINGETMTLTVRLSGSNEEIGAFTLTQGKTGRIRKCM